MYSKFDSKCILGKRPFVYVPVYRTRLIEEFNSIEWNENHIDLLCFVSWALLSGITKKNVKLRNPSILRQFTLTQTLHCEQTQRR